MQNIDGLPDELRLLYRTVWEVPMRSLIDMAAARNAYIDQSPVAEPLRGVSEHRQTLQHVYVRVEEGSKDDVLSSFATCNEDCKDHSSKRVVSCNCWWNYSNGECSCRSSGLLLARRSGIVRSLPITTSHRLISFKGSDSSCPARPQFLILPTRPVAAPTHILDPDAMPYSSADAFPCVLRDVPRRHQEHMDC